MIFNMPATTVFEKKWFSGLKNYYAVTIPTGAKGHIPAGYSFKDPYDQKDYDNFVEMGHEDDFWNTHSYLVEGVDYTLGVESTFVITAENASQIFGQATVSFQAPTEASNSEWVQWRKSDLKEFSDMSSGDQKVCKDVTVKVNNGVYDTDSGWGLHFKSLAEDGVQFVAPEGKVFKRIAILNGYGTFSDPNWSYDKNYKKWSGSANTVGFEGDICGISLIEFEVEGSAPANSCGDGVIWELNNGALTISYTGTGTGVMDNYASLSDAPWYSHKDDITSVTITDGVKSVGSNSFGYYENLVTVTIGNDVETIGYYAFGDCYKFTTLNLGNSVKHIGDRAFMWAKVLTGFTLPSTLETIGERAFLQNKVITSLTIPSSVTSIGQSAFMYCAALTSVTVEATTPPTLGETVFEGVPTSSIPLHVPSGSVAAYTAADQWKDFDIQDPTPAYEKAINLINAIGTVELTAECKAKIDAARTAYNALSDGDKDLVTNIATLTTAEAAFDNVMDIWLSGDCDAILWKDTTLTVRKHAGEGNGAMADYTDYYGDNTAPWFNSHWYNPQPGDIVIKSVTIEEGVTHIGENAFGWMSELKTVTIPSSMTSIGEDAFYWSKAVDDIYLTVADPANLTWILPYSADNQFKPEKATRCHVPADLLTAYQETFGTLNMTFVGDLDPITPLTPEQQQALDAAKGLITAIPSPVVYTPACEEAIADARAAYDALTPDMLKQLVSNYATLTDAEATYANLKDVAVVVAKINNIPQPVELKLATRDSIQNARAAYDALTADQQALVTNYQTLLDAEEALAGLNPGGGMPAGALSGKFTINAGGDQIAFSKGNLQATTTDLGENWTWGFAANQWKYLGMAVANDKISGNGTVSANGTVDLFGWSTAATYYGINNSYKAVDYIGDFVDWGPNMGAGWRTLTKDEWNYLIENNTKGRATVNDTTGYIFLPNDWSGPAFTPDPDNFTTNVYSGDDWTAMENAGAVFLPSGPARNGVYALIANDAKYSSSTSLNNDTSYVFTIYYNQSQSACTGTNRAYGCMVRLVTGGGGATPLDSAQAVKDLIDAIGEVSYPDSKEAIKAAREALDALGDEAKALFNEADTAALPQAEAAYAALLAEKVAPVIAAIDAIPSPIEDNLKLSAYDKVTDARALYDALTDEEKAAVTNYGKLTAAEAAFAAIGGGTGLNVSTEDIGKVLCADGSLYATKDEATAASKTPVAMIAYVEDSKGLAIALEDESNTMIWSTAITTAAAHTPAVTGGTWKLPSLLEWQQMFVGCGADLTPSETSGNVTDYLGLRDKLLAAGGNGFVEWSYWTTTEWADNPAEAWDPYFSPDIVKWYKNKKDRDDFYIRAILAFNVVASTALADAQAALDKINAIPDPVVVSDECKAKIDAAREAVTALGENASLIDDADIDKLEKAEEKFAELIKDATAVVAKIDAIGDVTFSAECKEKIVDARNAYEALADELKPYVTNLGTLTAAEAAYEAARPFAPVTTVPAAVEALQYTGVAQTLITAGAVEHGTILYSLDGVDYSTELPTALLPGAYTVYYKVQATDDYKDVAPATFIATIAYNYPATYGLFGIPEGWSVKVNDEEVAVVNGAVKNIAANDRFDIMPVKPEDVKLVEIVPYLLDLATATDSVIYLMNGDSITGTANGNISIVIVPDAKVYFKDVNLTNTGSHPAVLCGGNAEMVVVGENSITCTTEGESGIRAAGAGTTLTISGDKAHLSATIDPNGGTVNQ